MNKTKRWPAMLFGCAVALGGFADFATATAWAAGREQLAQSLPPDSIPGQGGSDEGQGDPGDPSALLLRVGRLENQIRSLTGQIEQLQFENHRLEDNLRKLSQDVDFRFQDLQGRGGAGAAPARPPVQRRGDILPATPDSVTTPPVAALATADPQADSPAVAASSASKPSRSAGDSFDPAADPGAPGAPQPLGSTAPSPPLSARITKTEGRVAASGQTDTRAPLDLMRPQPGASTASSTSTPGEGTPSIIAAPPAARAVPDANSVASLVPGGTREEFDADFGLYKQGQFDSAASGFQSFVTKYPKDRLVPDALYLTGESYSRLGRHREAAEQFLKVSTDYGKSSRAPDALLRLGISLNALGAKEQACATYEEVNRKYPTASADVRAGVDRELKRAHCRADG